MAALPQWMYGDPAEFMDEYRELRRQADEAEAKRLLRERIKKGRRIRRLVREQMEGKHHARR